MANHLLRELVDQERASLIDFFDRVDLESLARAFTILRECRGLIALTGVGKSGIVAKKMAQTMTSTGTRAIFLSPTNALHGDLGMLNPADAFVILSKSGESDELLNLTPFVRNRGCSLIGIVSKEQSRLAKAVDHTVLLPHEKELCPFDMAPTTSTTIQSIIGDILAIALMRQKEVTVAEFAASHPAGRIGKRISMKVFDLMLEGDDLPLCGPENTLVETLVELSNKQCGCVLIVDRGQKLLGIFTDGDLRRALQKRRAEALDKRMDEVMTPQPRTIGPDSLAWDAMKAMEADQKHPVMVLPVVDEQERVVGLIKMHDIVQSGL